MIFPDKLRSGDRVMILSPSSVVKKEYVAGAVATLRSWGLTPVIAPHAVDAESGSFASSIENRTADFLEALRDDSIKAILCSRGGFGAIHLLPVLEKEVCEDNAKWVIGFSDISALHALLLSKNIISIHSPMAKFLTEADIMDESLIHLRRLLTDSDLIDVKLKWDNEALSPNQPGKASGILVGGNLAVLNSLADTPYDLLHRPHLEDCILFIEDISEAIYQADRMLTRLYLSGTLSKAKALLVGNFCEYRPDKNFNTMEEMISTRLKEWGLDNLPVAYNFPAGHEGKNFPLAEGAYTEVAIEEKSAMMMQRLTKLGEI